MNRREPAVHVALLRGINVGGRNKLPMRELAEVFADAGCEGVRTYIQSGNVVFRARPAVLRRLPSAVTHALRERFGLTVPVVVRSAEELRAIVERNPFPEAEAAPKTLHVGFLSEAPEPDRAATLDPDRSPPDAFEVRGRELYLHLPNGAARTKLTADYFDGRLGTTNTMRNWNTVLKLIELSERLG